MASTKVDMNSRELELKHLELVRAMALNAVVCLSSLYECAKRYSGFLKPMVETVELTFSAVVDPVYQKVRALSDHLLLFLDEKVDDATVEFNKHAPAMVRKVVGQVLSIADKSLEVADNFFRVARSGGLHGVSRYGRMLLRNFIIDQGAATWFAISEIPLFHAMAHKALFASADWTERYNKLVSDMNAKGYAFFSWLPLFPFEEFAKAYKRTEAIASTEEDKGTFSGNENDKE